MVCVKCGVIFYVKYKKVFKVVKGFYGCFENFFVFGVGSYVMFDVGY